MPYIATEWIEGHSLQTLLESRPLSQEETILLLDQALEVCRILSEALGSEGVWVEIESHAIVIGAPETQRPVSFWISPTIWTDSRDNQAGLESFISLTNSAMGWSGKQPRELPANGLGAWVKWLHESARTATLREARERLADATGTPAPQPTQRVVRRAARPVIIRKKKKTSKAPALILASTALLAAGLGGWLMVHKNAERHAEASKTRTPAIETVSVPEPVPSAVSPPVTMEPEPARPVVEVTPTAATAPKTSVEERSGIAAVKPAANPPKAPAKPQAGPAKAKPKAAPQGGVFSPADHELLVQQNKKEAVVEGTLKAIGYSSSKKTMYLIFEGTRDSADFRGAVASKNATGELSEPALGKIFGKKIRLAGNIRLEAVGTRSRPVIDIENRAAIKLPE